MIEEGEFWTNKATLSQKSNAMWENLFPTSLQLDA